MEILESGSTGNGTPIREKEGGYEREQGREGKEKI